MPLHANQLKQALLPMQSCDPKPLDMVCLLAQNTREYPQKHLLKAHLPTC